ncbi:PIN domain-containing protein [Actinocorallia longicatena]|uniref:DUF4935 domain-containing protein n=1 Tax=Actinocorallia longicatena TaxID=111803 RepID=A0ABP6QNL0_9ACTN
MIVLFDANPLVAAPFHDPWWQVLSRSRGDWNIELYIPEVSLLEVTARAERRADERIAKLKALSSEFPEVEGFAEALDRLRTEREGIEGELREKAAAIGATIVPPPDVPHLEMVRRQTARKPPCKPSGDGNRDTLNWLTVLRTGVDHSKRQIVWVSDDKDFKSDKGKLHPALLKEAADAGLGDRLLFFTSVEALVQHLLEERGLPKDPEGARLAMAAGKVQDYLVNTVFATGIAARDEVASFDVLIHPKRDSIRIGEATRETDGSELWPFAFTFAAMSGTGGQRTVIECDVEGRVTVSPDGTPVDAFISSVRQRPPSLLQVFGKVLTAFSQTRNGDRDINQLIAESQGQMQAELRAVSAIEDHLQEEIQQRVDQHKCDNAPEDPAPGR